MFVLSASGQTTREHVTKPIACVTPDGFTFKHCFLLSSLCPVNLMGRHLMSKLGIILMSTPEGVRVSTQADTVFTAVQFSPKALNYAYEWKVQNSLCSQQLLKEVRSVVNPSCDFMQAVDLNCIAHMFVGF
ncbi:hypothetical protein ILYODFUR_038084 [Ilyodon furcidens]|uniref:Uncharacterized protein n=1 Tax=Ilyodon furcidens TaxID=33524 RepID=A0ABV0SSJ7_9TELE